METKAVPELKFESEDKIPEELREFAKAAEGEEGESEGFTVNVVPKARLDEFRDKNIKLSKERDGLVERVTKYSEVIGEDFDEFQERVKGWGELEKKVKDKELIDNTSFESAVDTRVGEMKNELSNQIKTLEERAQKAESAVGERDAKLRQVFIDRAVTDAILDPSTGTRPEARSDILSRAYQRFKVDDEGSTKIVDQAGNTLYGADGSSPMTPKEWLGVLRREAPYFFKDNEGGGAGGSGNTFNGASVRSKSDLKNASEKSKFISEFGLDAFNKLPAGR